MNLDEKVKIAHALVDLGVDVIEAGFPIASPGDFEAVREISKNVRGATICGLARCNEADIDRAWEALKAAERLEGRGLSTTVADLRFAKPLDEALIRSLLSSHEVAVTIEEAAVGGFGAHVLTLASDEGLIDAGLRLRTMRLPDRFQDQDKPEKQYAEAGLDADGIVDTVLKALRHNSAGIGDVVEGARA